MRTRTAVLIVLAVLSSTLHVSARSPLPSGPSVPTLSKDREGAAQDAATADKRRRRHRRPKVSVTCETLASFREGVVEAQELQAAIIEGRALLAQSGLPQREIDRIDEDYKHGLQKAKLLEKKATRVVSFLEKRLTTCPTPTPAAGSSQLAAAFVAPNQFSISAIVCPILFQLQALFGGLFAGIIGALLNVFGCIVATPSPSPSPSPSPNPPVGGGGGGEEDPPPPVGPTRETPTPTPSPTPELGD